MSVDTNGGKREIQQSTPSEPSAADAERLKALVDDIVRRGQPETR